MEQFCELFHTKVPKHTIQIGKRYFHDPESLHEISEEQDWDVFALGVYLGEEKGSFRPSPALIDLISHNVKKRVTVNEKAAWLFLCGRDILMDGIDDAGDFDKDDLVLVEDKDKNILGYGKVVAQYDPRMKNRQYIKTLLDRGEYLRREK